MKMIKFVVMRVGMHAHEKKTHNGLGLVGGDGIGYNFRSDNFVMSCSLAILFKGSIAEGGDSRELLDELFGGNLVSDQSLVLEGLDVLPLLDWDWGTAQLDGLGGRLEHGVGVGVGVGAAVVRAHGCDG